MKTTILSVILFLYCSLSSFGQSRIDSWAELKAYQTVLAETFQPSEKGDLKPVKTRSHELLTKAKMITPATVPQDLDNEHVKMALAKLVKESDKLNTLIVRQEQDMTIVKQLNKVHDTFYELTGLCTKKETAGP